MWTRELLKRNAKEALKRYYWMAFLVCLVTTLLCGGANGMRVTFDVGSDWETIRYFFRSIDWRVLIGMFGGLLSVGVITTLFQIFVGNVLRVGSARFFLESRSIGQAAPIETMLTGFRYEYSKVVLTLFLQQLFITLWSLLFVIPGIVKSYEYRMIPYLLAEDPEITREEAFARSRQLMEGHKMEAFVLDLSFIGWYLLGALCCGIGLYFVTPYVEATYAEFYTALRETTPM